MNTNDIDEIFMHLVFGLHAYTKAQRLSVPNSLRRAVNAIVFENPATFPKTLAKFVGLCHQPITSWYPLSVPENYNISQPLLYDGELSEEAREYYLDLSEKMDLPEFLAGDIPQAALDNRIMIAFRDRLKEFPERAVAQQLYVDVRSFLIENSWAPLERFREHSRAIMQELIIFYEELPSLPMDQLFVCERCGLLVHQRGQWTGIKPKYCSDHGSGSRFVHQIPNIPQLYRLKAGIHLRTFIPGRIELALFLFADELHSLYPEFLLRPERYPGLDAYDLRLTFTDGDVFAVDAKDHANPERLAKEIHLPYGEGDLGYTHCFYVIPDVRFVEDNYRQRLEEAMQTHPENLFISSQSEFLSRIEDKVKTMNQPPKPRRGKRG